MESKIRAILVDDETLAMTLLKNMLEKEVGGVEVIGMYSHPAEAVEMTETLRPDVVFIDINMPGTNGLELGETLLNLVPDLKIVFVTAYDQYAVQAFELYAIDYVLKPIHVERLRKTVERAKESVRFARRAEPTSHPPLICCFNEIRFQPPGQASREVKWRTGKALELFAYLLHNRGRMVERDTLLELLWSDSAINSAAQRLYTTVYHIRHTLKANGLQTVSINKGELEAGYTLLMGDAKLDTEEWETALKRIGQPNAHNIEEHEKIFYLYKGDYLGKYGYIWAEHERERLRILYLNHAKTLTEYYRQQRQWEAAIRVNQQTQRLVPDKVESYFTLMQLYDELGNRTGVEEQYWLLRTIVEEQYDCPLNPETIAWYERWRRQNS